MSSHDMIMFKGMPIHSCEKCPKDMPILIPSTLKNCPYCGEKLMGYDIKEFPDRKGYERAGSKLFYDLLEEMADIHDKKSHDYASNDNPFGNYYFAGTMATLFSHSPQDAGFVGRLAEKIYRIANLESGKTSPVNESIEDTERDIATITVLWIASRRERRLSRQNL